MTCTLRPGGSNRGWEALEEEHVDTVEERVAKRKRKREQEQGE
jgi:hypothetical protein